jgi:ferredoxin-NADP reductase
MVTTGTGIAPFRSMLRAHLSETSPAFTLLFECGMNDRLLYREEFEEMARRFPFPFWPTLTRRAGLERTRGARADASGRATGERRDIDASVRLEANGGRCAAYPKGHGLPDQADPYEEYD